GVSSTAIGLLPTYETAGVIAPILLIVIRVLQGFALGGEWGGAVLMSAEHTTKNRGFWASFTNAGGPTGTLTSSLVVTLTMAIMGVEDFIAWGWRLPFLVSIVLLIVAMVVRSTAGQPPQSPGATARPPPQPSPPTGTRATQPVPCP